jgi:hypothetical protein
MEDMFRADYQDGLIVAGLIGSGQIKEALEKLYWMDTSAREEVASIVEKVAVDLYDDVFVQNGCRPRSGWPQYKKGE